MKKVYEPTPEIRVIRHYFALKMMKLTPETLKFDPETLKFDPETLKMTPKTLKIP